MVHIPPSCRWQLALSALRLRHLDPYAQQPGTAVGLLQFLLLVDMLWLALNRLRTLVGWQVEEVEKNIPARRPGIVVRTVTGLVKTLVAFVKKIVRRVQGRK